MAKLCVQKTTSLYAYGMLWYCAMGSEWSVNLPESPVTTFRTHNTVTHTHTQHKGPMNQRRRIFRNAEKTMFCFIFVCSICIIQWWVCTAHVRSIYRIFSCTMTTVKLFASGKWLQTGVYSENYSASFHGHLADWRRQHLLVLFQANASAVCFDRI